jgi:hypothetical protein
MTETVPSKSWESVLFKAWEKDGNLAAEKWVTPKEAIRLRKLYEDNGCRVTTKDIDGE